MEKCSPWENIKEESRGRKIYKLKSEGKKGEDVSLRGVCIIK